MKRREKVWWMRFAYPPYGYLWQRRFWEHLIRDKEDWRRHVDYIHYNPVKHGLVRRVSEWWMRFAYPPYGYRFRPLFFSYKACFGLERIGMDGTRLPACTRYRCRVDKQSASTNTVSTDEMKKGKMCRVDTHPPKQKHM